MGVAVEGVGVEGVGVAVEIQSCVEHVIFLISTTEYHFKVPRL